MTTHFYQPWYRWEYNSCVLSQGSRSISLIYNPSALPPIGKQHPAPVYWETRCPIGCLDVLEKKKTFCRESKYYSSVVQPVYYGPIWLKKIIRNNIWSLNTLFSINLSPRSSSNVSGQVSHPYKTTDNITVLFILIIIFLNRKPEDKRLCTAW